MLRRCGAGKHYYICAASLQFKVVKQEGANGACRSEAHACATAGKEGPQSVTGLTPSGCREVGRRIHGYGSTVCINITSYADHSDKLKYRSLPDDQGWIIGA